MIKSRIFSNLDSYTFKNILNFKGSSFWEDLEKEISSFNKTDLLLATFPPPKKRLMMLQNPAAPQNLTAEWHV